MANPRPCVCGHVEEVHCDACGCHECFAAGRGHPCRSYRKRPRTEPLRAPGRALRRAQSIVRQTGYTPRIESTYRPHPRPELAGGTRVTLRPGGSAQQWVEEPGLPTVTWRFVNGPAQTWRLIAEDQLREFLDAETAAVSAEPHPAEYWCGYVDGLVAVRRKFCSP